MPASLGHLHASRCAQRTTRLRRTCAAAAPSFARPSRAIRLRYREERKCDGISSTRASVGSGCRRGTRTHRQAAAPPSHEVAEQRTLVCAVSHTVGGTLALRRAHGLIHLANLCVRSAAAAARTAG